jgi:hypothetical protein
VEGVELERSGLDPDLHLFAERTGRDVERDLAELERAAFGADHRADSAALERRAAVRVPVIVASSAGAAGRK